MTGASPTKHVVVALSDANNFIHQGANLLRIGYAHFQIAYDARPAFSQASGELKGECRGHMAKIRRNARLASSNGR
jgi:hypothetical protein